MKNCIKCGQELPDEAVYCYMCGKKQITQKNTAHQKRANGEGSVYKRGVSWYASLSVGKTPYGQCRRMTKGGFKTRREALEWIDQTKYRPMRDVRLEAIYEAIQPHIDKLSKNKQVHYRTAWKRLALIHNANIPDLTVQDLQTVVEENAQTYYPAKDIRDLLSLIYERAIADGYVTTNRAKYIILPDNDAEETVPFTAEEVAALWRDFYDGNIKTGYFLLMIYTGTMPGELLKMRVNHIDMEHKRIVGAGLKTDKRKETPIILPDIILPVVEELIKDKNKDDKVFRHDNKLLYEYFAEMKKRAGLRQIPQLRPYSCRHTTATTLADANVSAAILKEVMRHSKITTTQKYIHLDQSSSSAAMNAVFKQRKILARKASVTTKKLYKNKQFSHF